MTSKRPIRVTFTECQPLGNDPQISMRSKRFEGDYDTGWSENIIDMYKGLDGHISFSDRVGEGFIYLYPEQIKHLRTFLRMKVTE